jgi:hypothetical protein
VLNLDRSRPQATRSEEPAAETTRQSTAVWTVTHSKDSVTDQENVIALARATPPLNRAAVYELVIRCDGPSRRVQLRTLERADPNLDVLLPRPLRLNSYTNWTTYATPDAGEMIFRIDGRPPVSCLFATPAERNVASLFIFAGSVVGDMPQRTLGISGFFPNETVEFPFDQMSTPDRDTIQKTCWSLIPR